MNTLYAFGCSYTYGDETTSWYIDRSKSSPDAWPTLLAGKLNLNCVNLGKSAVSNDFIFTNVLGNLKNFKKDDIIVIMMTFPDRKLIYNNEKIVSSLPSHKEYKNYYLKYHTEELGILNFIQNFLSLQMILREFSYYITFTTYEPLILYKKYNWAKNLKFNKERIIKPPKLGFYSLIDVNKKTHPDDTGHKIISDTIYNFIKK